MNRPRYYNYIEEKLSTLSLEIDSNGKLNVLHLNNHAEPFYRDLLNKIFGWELKNLNSIKQNAAAIDLCCDKNKIIAQVSATCTKEKIESALKQAIIGEYKDKKYCFKFISISKDASDLRKKISYDNPYNISFNPPDDIYDVVSIKRVILSLDIDHLRLVYEFIKKELGNEIDIEKLDSNLASIIDILSKEDLAKNDQAIDVNSFEIDRKISYNNLKSAKNIINDYKVHHSRIDKIYSEYDERGANKSVSVLAAIRSEYIRNSSITSDDELFFLIISNIEGKIAQSANFNKIPIDELELCVNILIVDAFIRCKIFENPDNYKYVAP